MPDYNQGGFHEDDSGIYADPTVQGSPSDYDSWDWKQIMAAIVGGSSMVPGAGGDSRASSVSSPQTLVQAANDFQYVQEVMAMVAKSLADQAKALAGGEGAPWQGGAADAFMDTMTNFSKQVASNAEALGGGATGSSVGQNLVWSANALTVAQTNIHAIDAWYANQAARLGVKPMANGLMPISQKPELVQMMTDDMRAELKKLATNYAQVSQTLGRVQPKPVVSPVKDPGTGGGSGGPNLPDTGTGGGSGGPNLPEGVGGGSGGGANPPDLSELNGGGGEGGGTGGTANPFTGGASLPNLATTGGTGGAGDPGTIGDPGTTGAIAPFPGGTSTGDLGPGGSTAPDFTIPDTGTGGGTGGTGSPAPFTGGATVPDLPTGTGDLGTGGTGSPTPFTGGATVPDLPTGTGITPGSTVPLPGFGSVGTPTTGNTGNSTSGNGLSAPPTAWTGGAQTPELGTGGAGTTLPGTGGTGISLPETGTIGTPDIGTAGGIGGAPLPSDLLSSAPGVGTPSAMPSTNLASAPGLPDASALGSAGGGAGMPMMPGMGAPGAGAQNGAGAERPDSSGLLGGEVKPWSGGAELGAVPEVEPVAGAAAGGPGLSGLDASSLEPVSGLAETPQLAGSAPGTGEGAGTAAGMPMMPMSPGMGAPGAGAQNGAGAERPDSSGLLGGEVKPWSGGAELGALPEIEPVAGAAAGGPGLSGLDASSLEPVAGLAEAPQSAAASAPGAGESVSAAGMPMMPMSPGMGAPGAGAQNGAGAERPDSSGLLGGEVRPWSGGAELGAVPEAEPVAGAAAGGPGLSGLDASSLEPVAGLAEAPQSAAASAPGAGESVSAAGMPMMPMSPGMGAPGAGAQNGAGAERPDSSGLLGGEVRPWSGGAELGAVPEAEPVAGAAAGGPGLSGLDAGQAVTQPAVSSVPGAGESAAAVAGMPMMPMSPGMGAQGAGAGNGSSGERSDSSGLLEQAAAPWTGAGEVGAEDGTAPVAGAPTGGSALSGTAAAVPAMPVPVLPLPTGRGGAQGGRTGAGGAAGEGTGSSELLGGSRAVWSSEDVTGAATPPASAAPAHPAAVPTGVPAHTAAQAPAETGAGQEATESATAQWATESTTVQGAAEAAPGEEVVAVPLPDLPDDRVPVPTRTGAAEDTSTWDVAAAGFGMLMVAFAGQGSADAEHPGSTSGYATAAPAVWEAEGTSTARAAERTVDPGTASFAEPELTTWRPAARGTTAVQGPAAASLDPDIEIRCGNGEGELPEEPEAEAAGTGADGEQEEEDADDKGMVNLLTQDASTWGTRPVVPDSIG
ncbi:hypothetical protein [Streptomyces sp. NPDC018347]|uniref:hypothetical protein n=1 Tax=Streptomyces sp. NPDC018347 TaxID=3157193 RepID=UPI0034019701